MPTASIDYGEVAKYLGYLFMGLLSFLGVRLWNKQEALNQNVMALSTDMTQLRERSITRVDFDRAMDTIKAEMRHDISSMKAESQIDRDKRQMETTANFRRLEDLIHKNNDTRNEDLREINASLSDMKVRMAEQGNSLALERRKLSPPPGDRR